MCRIYLFQESGRALQKNENVFPYHPYCSPNNSSFLEVFMKITRICNNPQKWNDWYFIDISSINIPF